MVELIEREKKRKKGEERIQTHEREKKLEIRKLLRQKTKCHAASLLLANTHSIYNTKSIEIILYVLYKTAKHTLTLTQH